VGAHHVVKRLKDVAYDPRRLAGELIEERFKWEQRAPFLCGHFVAEIV
jgi:hypothetical protein